MKNQLHLYQLPYHILIDKTKNIIFSIAISFVFVGCVHSQHLFVSELPFNDITEERISQYNLEDLYETYDNRVEVKGVTKYGDNRMVLLSYTNEGHEMIVLDENKNLLNFSSNAFFLFFEVEYLEVLDDKDLLVITNDLRVFIIPDFESAELYLQLYFITTLGGEQFQTNRTESNYRFDRIGKHLTVTCNASNAFGAKGTFQSVFDIEKTEELNSYFISKTHSGFCYINNQQLAISCSDPDGLESLSKLYVLNWERNIIDSIVFEKGFIINDIEKCNKDLLIAGTTYRVCEDFAGNSLTCSLGTLRKITLEGEKLWEVVEQDNEYSTYSKMEQNSEGDIFILGVHNIDIYNPYLTNFRSVLVKKYNRFGNLSASIKIGNTDYYFGSAGFKLDVNEDFLLWSNSYHTHQNDGFVHVLRNDISKVNRSLSEKKVQLYPNPFTVGFRVRTDTKFKNYELYTSSGILVEKDVFKQEINTEYLEAGVYFLKLYNKNQAQILKT